MEEVDETQPVFGIDIKCNGDQGTIIIKFDSKHYCKKNMAEATYKLFNEIKDNLIKSRALTVVRKYQDFS